MRKRVGTGNVWIRIFFVWITVWGIEFTASGQIEEKWVSGSVSYVSSKNVYVKFEHTHQLRSGDTLFRMENSLYLAALKIQNKSSTSCVCIPLDSHRYQRNDQIFAWVKNPNDTLRLKGHKEIEVKPDSIREFPVISEKVMDRQKTQSSGKVKHWKGRLSAATYSTLGSAYSTNANRFQYTLTAQGNQLAGGGLTVETYLSFRHKEGEWYKVQEDINQALKIYSLAVTHEFSQHFKISAGRRINYKISSLGAIDGLQAAYATGVWEFGSIYGARPDPRSYGVNYHYREFGFYANHTLHKDRILDIQQTLAWVEQFNHGKTDRRFLYLQHTGTFWNKLNLFGSSEIDLFQNIHDTVSGVFKLSNLYLSARYRFARALSVTFSYDARNNVIYYETYKNDIDRLLDETTRQGLRFQLQIQPLRRLNLSLSGNYRFQSDGANPSANYNAYVSYSNLPILNGPLSFSYNYLKTGYLVSNVGGIQGSKDFFTGKFYTDFYVRYVHYKYLNYEHVTHQWLLGLSFNIRITKLHSIGCYLEETLDDSDQYLRLNARAMIRF